IGLGLQYRGNWRPRLRDLQSRRSRDVQVLHGLELVHLEFLRSHACGQPRHDPRALAGAESAARMKDALAFVARHGVVLQSARHARIPSLAEFIAGEAIRGSWWGHKKGREIFRALAAVHASGDVVA